MALRYLSLAASLAMVPAMNQPDPTFAAAPGGDSAASGGWNLWRAEMLGTIKLALPIALTQLGQVAMMTTDLMLVGRLGDAAVAGAALGQTAMFAAFVLGLGLASAVAPLAAQAYGAKDPRLVRRALRVGLWATVMFGTPLTLVQFWGEEILLAFGQTPEGAALAGRYLDGLAWSLIPGWCFLALRNFMGAVNRPEPALWIMLAAVPINAVLAYALIHGAFGLPRFDLLGAGLATTIVNWLMCIATVAVCYTCRPFKKYRILGRFWRPDWKLFGKLLVLGAPISGSFSLEYGLFAMAALLMGWIGTAALAAHQIALQSAAILFMVPFGISMAATVRVGHAVGRRDAAGARRAGFAATSLGVVFMASMTLIMIATRDLIPLVFLGIDTPADNATRALAATLIMVGATFFIADGVQTVASGALRGLNDTSVPLLFAIVSFWVIGFPAAYGLGFPAGLGPHGVWIGLSISLAVYAVLLIWRFHALTRRRYLPEVAQASPALTPFDRAA
jgi:MATE family multidrug resistance protein